MIPGTKLLLYLALLFAALSGTILLAAEAKEVMQEGRQHEKAGRLFRAAQSYVRALDADPESTNARKALNRIADEALAKKLGDVKRLEELLEPKNALAELQKIGTLQSALAKHGIEIEEAVDVKAQEDGITLRAAQRIYVSATSAKGEGRWGAAIAQFQEIESLRPGYLDTQDKLAETYMVWGMEDLTQRRYRAAAERFSQGGTIPGVNQSALGRKGADILVALARYAMDGGACRRAIRDYKEAVRLAPQSVSAEELNKAECCATTSLSISVVTGAQVSLDPFTAGDLSKALRDQIEGRISEYVRLRGPGDRSIGTAEEASATPCPKEKSASRGPYRASVEVTAVTTLRMAPTASSERVRTTGQFGSETIVSYKEYNEPFNGEISGRVRVVDVGKDTAVLAAPVRARAIEQGQWMGNAVSVISREDPWTGERAGGVVVSPGMLKRTRVDEQRREARTRLIESLIRKFVETTSDMVLAVVDTELPLPEPETLEIGD
jgi:tetratricopeptide (TPR) repeat protein